ncbi:MAG TPA: hypothetical protein PK629_03435 [Oscillospiraceae bacterium]|nr:hypothetical protein [Oscillospiraceae bacterium]HPK34735.1 hypothetical protein [Oscillospiraceae bacterium]HPR76067.1 hypothetical protein [Oscillospiraceae bacterium]
MLIKILTTFGSTMMIGFGVWHFTVPSKWQWYGYIVPSATELVLAVRAINVFFSLCLVLIGAVNLIFLYAIPHKPSLAVMLALSTVLWGVRCVLQLIYPQGSVNPLLQYGMLAAFFLILLSFSVSFVLTLPSLRG